MPSRWQPSGGGSAQSCTKDNECATGKICVTGACAERVCTGLGDCSGTDQICVAGEAIGKDASKKFCTAKQCGGTVTCADGMTCDGGLCVANPSNDTIDNRDNGGETGGLDAALAVFGESGRDFFVRAWPLVLIAALVLVITIAESRCAP